MRLIAIQTTNIAGLSDASVQFPDTRLVAIAGANGTGKSKLLACILAPWTRTLPPARDSMAQASVSVTFEFTDTELDALEAFDLEAGWGQGRPPKQATVTVSFTPLQGLRVSATTPHPAVHECFVNTAIMKRQPSLNLLYLPAERRLLPQSSTNVDLGQLADELALSKLVEARNAANNFGRLDDQEFETYAKALCVAGALPSEDNSPPDESRWAEFKASVDALLYPKILLPLTREHPSELRIELPDGGTHRIHELSSGERQALIIASRVFRAGEGHSLVAIDEPDAYLHPALSGRLLQALRPGLGDEGLMILATHSPAILDALPPGAIIRLSHDGPPATVESESERLALYREVGFRASSLTQSDGLLVTEGEFDLAVLPALMPLLGNIGTRAAGGRAEVIRAVTTLSGYDLPIIGVVDADVRGPSVPAEIADLVHVWPAADIEGVLLSDDAFIGEAIAGKLLRSDVISNVGDARKLLQELLLEQEASAVAEYAQRMLRSSPVVAWPSPRGEGAVELLRERVAAARIPTIEELDAALEQARGAWNAAKPEPWTLVRGKWIIGNFVSRATAFKSSDDFVHAVLARNPRIAAIAVLEAKLLAAVDGKEARGD